MTWSEIYCEINGFETNKEYEGYTYYQTYGGGPEGGYITNGDIVFSVHRNWFEDWTIKRVYNKKLVFRTIQHDKWNSTKELKLVKSK